jgi:hypothetical protein
VCTPYRGPLGESLPVVHWIHYTPCARVWQPLAVHATKTRVRGLVGRVDRWPGRAGRYCQQWPSARSRLNLRVPEDRFLTGAARKEAARYPQKYS